MDQIILLSLGQGISQFGSSFINIGFVYWLKSNGGSGATIGAFFFVAALSVGVTSLLVGPTLDSRVKSKIVLATDLLGIVLMLVFSLLAWLDEKHRFFVISVFAVKILLSCLYAVRTGAISALIPELVEKNLLKKANSLVSSSRNISMVLSEAFGGLVFNAVGLSMLAAFDSFSYLVAVIFDVPIVNAHERVLRATEHKQADAFADSIKQGWRYCATTDGLKEFSLLLLFFGFFYSPLVVWLPFLVDNVLGLSAVWYGYFVSAVSAGVFFGAISVGLIFKMKISPLPILLLMAGVFVFTGIVYNKYLLLTAVFCIGLLTGLFNTLVTSAIQHKVPKAMLGRVFTTLTAVGLVIGPLSKALNGLIVDAVSGRVSILFVAAGLCMFLGAVLAIRSNNLTGFLRE